MLNGPMEKINNIYKQMGNFIREMKIIKKETKRNARNEKHSIRDEEFLHRLISRLDTAKERINDLKLCQ